MRKKNIEMKMKYLFFKSGLIKKWILVKMWLINLVITILVNIAFTLKKKQSVERKKLNYLNALWYLKKKVEKNLSTIKSNKLALTLQRNFSKIETKIFMHVICKAFQLKTQLQHYIISDNNSSVIFDCNHDILWNVTYFSRAKFLFLENTF